MREVLWQIVAWIVSRPHVSTWLINRAAKTPYSHLGLGKPGGVYMYRFWLFNPYSDDVGKQQAGSDKEKKHWSWLPSIRIHGIMRKDRHPDKHNHPWFHARTIVLHGWYHEVRDFTHDPEAIKSPLRGVFHKRLAGHTVALNGDVFHRITQVADGGAWTLFITWKKSGSWGFRENGVLVSWREYLNTHE